MCLLYGVKKVLILDCSKGLSTGYGLFNFDRVSFWLFGRGIKVVKF